MKQKSPGAETPAQTQKKCHIVEPYTKELCET